MPRPNKRKLQSLINAAARTMTVALAAQTALDEYCLEVYGHTPSDVDCDYVLDSLYGLCGAPDEMTAQEFDEAMRDALDHKGFRDE